ncbi:MAG TPA: sulfatase-like hydrolase/transferase, partial [Gemmatimonadales bacterium]|nr:sulfatase-like hydrolase/transferase [Gemmatimonadales bacterium]
MRARLAFLLKYYAFWMAFFVVGKFVFLTWFGHETAQLPFATTLGILFHGLRMDAAATAYIVAGPFLLLVFALERTWRWIRRVVLYWTTLLVVFVAGLTMGDLELYKEWGFRIDATWVQYLKSPKEFGASIATSPLWLLFLMIGVMSFLALWALRKLILPPGGSVPGRGLLASLVSLVATALLAIPARGGVQLAPLNQSSVYFSESDFANQGAINVAWNFFNSLYRGDQDRTNPYVVMSDGDAIAIRDSLLTRGANMPGSELLRIRRPNVILVIWEGFTAKVVEPLGGVAGVMPRFDALTREGVLFDRFYASGNRTDKGIAAIIGGYPALGKTSVLKEPRKYAGLPGLGRSLRDAGYTTEFLYGGELEFANIRAFILTSGFSRTVDKYQFPEETWSSKWGAHDHYLFERMLAEMDTTSRPSFLAALTLSSHEPYDLPTGYAFGDSTKTAKYFSSMHYVDSAFGAFIDTARTRPWWDSTLMIVLADHGHRLPAIDLESDGYREQTHHIPMLWLGGALKQRATRVHALGDQTDLGPTLLGQLGLPRAGWRWGQDLFAPGHTPFAYYTFSDG